MEEEQLKSKIPEMVELEKLITTLPEEKRKRVFYALDYILNYFTGDRRIPKLLELGFGSELTQLKNIGLVKEDSLYWRGHNYSHIYVKHELQTEVKNLLKERYYPFFDQNKITEKVRKIVKKSLFAATKLWNKVSEFDSMHYTLSGYGACEPEVVKLGEQLAANGFGYLIGYWSTSWSIYSDDFIFRKEPFNARIIFLKVVEEEVNEIFTSFTPEIRWCLYLKFLEPKADEKFMLKNTTTRFLPSEIKKAFSRIPDLKIEKFQEIIQTLLTKEKERLSHVLRNFINRDPSTVLTLSTLLLLGQEKEQYFEITKWSLEKIKEISTSTYENLLDYIKIFKNYGIVLESTYGNLIIPKILREVFYEEIKGMAIELKIFESELDAQSFIEEKMSKAVSNIKIWDPYVTTKTLNMLERAIKPDSAYVEVLSSQPVIMNEIVTLAKKGMKIKVKMVFRKKGERYLSPFHDRYLIIDELYVWHFGPSLHAAGEKLWESAALFSERFGRMVVDAFKHNIEREVEDWQRDGFDVIEKDFRGQVVK